MSENLILIFSALAGALLGAVFFGGLYITVQRGLQSRHPALWFGVSLVLRTVITLLGFYEVGATDWRRLVLCLLGFIAARFLITHGVKKKEAEHAS